MGNADIPPDTGRGWRSPKLEVAKKEREDAIAARRTRRAFLKLVGLGAAAAAAAGGAAAGGVALSPAGRQALGGLFKRLVPQKATEGETAAAAGVEPVGGLGIPGLPGPEAPGAQSQAQTATASPPAETPNPRGGAGVADPSPTPSTPGAEFLPGSPTPDVDPQADGTPSSPEGLSLADGSEPGVEGGAAADSNPTPAAPTPAVTPDPRRVNPFGSDSIPPTPNPEPSAIVPRIPDYKLPDGSLLAIAKLAVHAPVVPLGIDPQGRMLAPDNPKVVGWFELGPLPGTPGNAILTGHVDWNDGSLGVFAGLKNLAPGDGVEFHSPQQSAAEYAVKWLRTYPADKAPVQEILGQNMDEKEMTLITCAGVFDRNLRNYSHRLIVKCEMR